MINPLWSIALTVLGAFGLLLVFRYPTHWIGPAWSIVLQIVWLTYGIVTQQWGFIASAFMYAGANIYGIAKRREVNRNELIAKSDNPIETPTTKE